MHRLFVACIPPPAARRALLEIMGGVEGARWQADPQLHLTLRFIGNVDRWTADSVAIALATVRAHQFDIAVDGVGHFEKRGRVHTLWAGVYPPDEATALHRKIDRALVVAGLAPEARAYRPHITLARLSRPLAAVLPYLQRAAGLSLPPFTVCKFALFESLPTEEGRVYRALDTYPLN